MINHGDDQRRAPITPSNSTNGDGGGGGGTSMIFDSKTRSLSLLRGTGMRLRNTYQVSNYSGHLPQQQSTTNDAILSTANTKLNNFSFPPSAGRAVHLTCPNRGAGERSQTSTRARLGLLRGSTPSSFGPGLHTIDQYEAFHTGTIIRVR